MKQPTTIMLIKQGPGLYAGDPVSEEYVGQIGQGKALMCKPWYARNPEYHSLAMSYLHQVFENSDRYDTFEDFMRWVKIKVGAYTLFLGHEGTVYQLIDSIGFESMDETHFRRFMRVAEYYICTELIPDLTIEEHRQRFIAEAQRKALEYRRA